MAEQFNFSADFQDLVLACLIKYPKKFMAYGNIIDARYFEGVHATSACRAALKYYKKEGKFPTWRTLEELVADDAKRMDGNPKEVQEYIVRLSKINTGDVDYVVTKVVDFCRERAVLSAVRTSIERVQSGKLMEGELVKLFEDALSIGVNLDDLGYLFTKDADAVIDKITEKTYGVMTGFKHFDNIWKRGWGPGWLIVPLAPPKRFKTTFCINLAMNMVGVAAPVPQNVFYYPCEISQELAMTRALLNLVGLNQDYIYDSPEKFKERIKQAMAQLVQGQILWKAFPAGGATIMDIRNHARIASKTLGIKPGAIMIDYAETVAPSESSKEKKDHRQQADVYTEARALGHEFGCPIIIPDRCNRETVGKKVPNMTSFQGAFQKAGIVDVSFGLCGTEEEIMQNVIRYFVFLNRHGAAFQHFRGKVDAEKYTMTIDEEIEYNPDEDEEEGSGKSYSKKGSKGGKRDKSKDLPPDLIEDEIKDGPEDDRPRSRPPRN